MRLFRTLRLTSGLAISAALPPLASGHVYALSVACWEAFFVPFRLLTGSYGIGRLSRKLALLEIRLFLSFLIVPVLVLSTNSVSPGSLMDYLGFKYKTTTSSQALNQMKFSLLKPLAYHRIYDDWYRNTLVQKPLFFPYEPTHTRGAAYIEHRPYIATGSNFFDLSLPAHRYVTFEDGKTIF